MTIRFAKLALAATLCTFAIGVSGRTAGADEGWVIKSFQSTIHINPDSTIAVEEDIRVDFGDLQRHGIFRTIPVRYQYDKSQDRYYNLYVKSVTDGQRPVRFETNVYGASLVIKIGDPNRPVSGVNRYVISYTVQGVMNRFEDHDELFWNVDGDQWQVPKESVIANIYVPTGSFREAACYEGPQGSREGCTVTGLNNFFTYSSTRELGSGEQMSIVTSLTKGAVNVPAPLLDARKRQFPQDAFDVNPLTLGVGLLLLLAGVGLIVRFWLRHGRDRAYLTRYYQTNDAAPDRPEPVFLREPVVVEFEPPQNLRPAELGLILDETADTKDVTATIVDLAVRGFLTIGEVPGKRDWMLTQKSGDVASLLPYERTLYNGLFGPRQQVKISELKGTFHSTLSTAEGEVYADAMTHKSFRARPDMVRLATVGVAILIALAGAGLTFVLGITFGGGLIGVAVVLLGVVLAVMNRAMASRTPAGREGNQKAPGFRPYMATGGYYRQQFAERAEIFTQLLPYAIVFGCVARWSKAFEGIDTSTSNSWYVGNAPFQAEIGR